MALFAEQMVGGEVHMVVQCASMGECLRVVSQWMLSYSAARARTMYIRIGFRDTDGDEATLMAWTFGHDLALERDDWSLVGS